MTREELKDHCKKAIATCEAVWAEDEEKLKNHKLYQEHKLILELLEQEPCDDCVSRQAAIEAVKQAIYNFNSAIMRLTELPPVTPQPKTAHWIHFANSDDCSGCGWSTGKYISPSDYCPKCGAKMVEPAESEDRK